MQKYKSIFSDCSVQGQTLVDVQRCVRLHDLDELDNHHLGFHMIGLFSFRDWTLQQGIDFFWNFLLSIGIRPDYVTIHPDKMQEWLSHYYSYRVEVRPDRDCIWSDGQNESYCTEFYYQGVEIGNIVNPHGTCLDVGFGLERLESFINPPTPPSHQAKISLVLDWMVDSGVTPGSQQQSYIMRRLIRHLVRRHLTWEHPFFQQESERYQRQQQKYESLKRKHLGKSPQWWWDTHGIDVSEH